MGFEFGVAGGSWWLAAIILVLLGWLVVVRWHRAGWLCGGLKITGFTLLGLCLLEPRWVGERPREGENLVALLVDEGGGLETRGRGAAMTAETGWIDDLGDTFQVRAFAFGSETRETESVEGIAFDAGASALGAALRTLAARFAGSPLAAVVVLTDGNATDAVEAVEGSPPVFFAVPDEVATDDVALGAHVVEQTAFEDAPVTVRVPIERRGRAVGLPVAVTLADAAGNVVAGDSVVAGAGGARLRFQPTDAGLGFYDLRVEGAENEVVKQNNARTVLIDRGGGPFRVLYVTGRPNWEYKFLRRALDQDAEVELVGLLRVAKREPKFEWRGRAGESSNPLFTGFGEDDEAGYDQPVRVRLGAEHARELADGFPSEAAGLFRYHALIIDDLEAAFFTAEQLDLVREFVARRGGGFLMLGGVESFAGGDYSGTPVADVVPLGLKADGGEPGAALQITREGMLEPWVRLRETEAAEGERVAGMPEFWSVSATVRAKPGAAVLADDPVTASPLLATQRFGRGRSAALAVGDLWRWGFRDPGQREDFEKSWRQMVRWLVADVPGRVSADVVENPVGGTGLLRVRVTVRDAGFQPEPEATVTVRATLPDGSERVLPAVADDGEAGVFWADFRADEPGGYRFAAGATDYASEAIGEALAGFAYDPLGAEFANVGRNNLAVIEPVAAATGGRVLPVSALAELARELPEMEVPLIDRTTVELWHTPWVFLLGIGLLLLEWAIRRERGYA